MTTDLSHPGFQTFPPRTSMRVPWRRRMIYVLGYALLLAVAVAAGAAAGRARLTSPAGVGDVVGEGAFRFTVTDVHTGDRQVRVALTVRNVASGARSVVADAQYLVDSEGHRHTGRGRSAAVAPGAELRDNLVFDLTPGALPRTLELHAAPGSAGVHVDL